MTDPNTSEINEIDLDQLKLWCSNLKTGSKKEKLDSLTKISELFTSDTVNESNVEKIYNEIYLHLLQIYSDKSEACRSLVITIIDDIFKLLPRNSAFLEYIMQVIAKRLAQAEIKEDSEEIRLQLVQQIKGFIEKFKSADGKEDLILTSYNDIIDILIRTVRDPYHQVQRESCEVIVTLALGAPCFRYRAEVLVKHLSLMLGHRYTVNRIAAIRALVQCALHILTNNNCVANIIMDISRLLMDDVPLVRLECGRAGVKLGLELRDRYSHFPKILPLILNCLRDPVVDVQTEISAGWLEVGELYYKENEKDMKQYLMVDKVPDNYPENIKRPTFQCRQLVQRHLQIVNVILVEMEEWKDEVRLHSLILLEQIVIHSEKLFSTQFAEVYPVLAHTCTDSNADVAAEAIKISTLMGHFLEFNAWYEFSFNQLQSRKSLSHLICFGSLFKNASFEKVEKLEPITKLLLDGAFYHEFSGNPSRKITVQKELLNFSKSIIETLDKNFKSKDNNSQVEKYLYCIAMKVIALTEDEETLNLGYDVIYQLSNAVNTHVDDLHERNLEDYLEQIEGLDVEVEELSDPVMLLSGVIQSAGLCYGNIDLLQPKILTGIKHASPEGKVKIFASVASAFMSWESRTKPDIGIDEQFDKLKEFVTVVVKPSLEWSAGTGAESIRCMATACLCTITQYVQSTVSSKLIEDFLNDIIPLIDDNEPKTRLYSIKTLLNVGELEESNLKSVAFAILSRLDDSNQDVRLATAKCLSKLRPKANSNFDWESLLGQIINRMIFFCEAPEKKLKEELMESLKVIQKRDPEIYLKKVADQKEEWTAVKDQLMKLTITE